MRSGQRVWIVALSVAALFGCASRTTQVMPPPTPEELPRHAEELDSGCQATVIVEGRQQEPRIDLAPSFQEPELTAREKAAIGEKKPAFEPLLYPYPGHYHPPLIGTWWGGIEAGPPRPGSARTGLAGVKRMTGLLSWGGVDVGYDPASARRADLYGDREPCGEVGPETWLEWAVDRPRHVGNVKTRRER